MTRGYSLFPGPSIRGELLLGTAVGVALIATWKRRTVGFLHRLPVAASFLLMVLFLGQSNGSLIFSDDHSTFFYRLSLLKEEFPRIPFYNPLWNAGLDARDFFASGSLNIFLIFSPLIYLFDLRLTYNFIIALLLFCLVPASTYYAAHKEELPRPVPAIAAILSLCISLTWYRWGLKYGTLGFITSTSLIPLVLALASKILDPDRELSPFEAISTILVVSLTLCWTPAGLVLIPGFVLGFLFMRRLLRKRYVLLVALLIAGINLPWMTLFWSVSKVSSFMQAEDGHSPREAVNIDDTSSSTKVVLEPPSPLPKSKFRYRTGGFDLGEALHVLRDWARSTNPLLLFLGPPGILLLRRRTKLLMYGTCAWLLFLGTVCVPIKPQLELDRMLVILAMVLCVPAAQLLAAACAAASERGRIDRVLAGSGLGFLLVGPFVTGAIVENRSLEQFEFATPLVDDLSRAITRYGGEGRTVFSGFVLHELSTGHLAPLTIFTRRPLVASSPFHNLWMYTQVIPKDFISRGEEGIEEFFTLQNATSVIAHEQKWRRYFLERPSRYRKVWAHPPFMLFTRTTPNPTYLLEGSGHIISQETSRVRFRLDTPDAVLKFTYFPFLRAGSCMINPRKVGDSLNFVELRGCPVGTELVLESRPAYVRFKG
jgi:hypothetical protein